MLISFFKANSLSFLLAVITKLNPLDASNFEISSPIPDEAPVIKA